MNEDDMGKNESNDDCLRLKTASACNLKISSHFYGNIRKGRLFLSRCNEDIK